MPRKRKKQRQPVKTLKGRFKGLSTKKLKAILDYQLTLEIRTVFEEDTHRKRKYYRSAGFDDNCIDLMYGTISNFYYERRNLDGKFTFRFNKNKVNSN